MSLYNKWKSCLQSNCINCFVDFVAFIMFSKAIEMLNESFHIDARYGPHWTTKINGYQFARTYALQVSNFMIYLEDVGTVLYS